MKKIVIIVGSLRKKSFNQTLAKVIVNVLQPHAEAVIMDYQDVPLFNQDLEEDTPKSVLRVRNIVQEADGLWIVTPEYNGQIPGVLKNLLDWLSRPAELHSKNSSSVVKGKMAVISGVAGKSAAYNARTSLASLLKAMRMQVIGDTGTGFALNAESFASDEMNITEAERQILFHQAQQLLSKLQSDEAKR